MRKIATVIVVGLVVVLPAILFDWHSIWHKQATYRLADIKVLAEGIDDSGFTLVIKPPSETMYYCPGVQFGTQGQSIQFERPTLSRSITHHFEFVRAPVGQIEKVNIQAKLRKDGSLAITFPFLDGRWEKGDRIEWFDPNGNRRGSFECLGQEQSKATDMNQQVNVQPRQ